MKTPILRFGSRCRRAFMLLDMVLAVGIATVLLISLSVAVGTHRRAERRMAEARAVNRQLEAGLLALQSGGKADPDLRVERLGNGPDNRVWVRVALRQGAPAIATGPEPGNLPPAGRIGQEVTNSLVGLVPAEKAIGGAP
jgi:hypothetical protein